MGFLPKSIKPFGKKRAKRKVSLNRLLVDELISASGASSGRTYRSLKHLMGRWKEDPEFDRAMADQRQIDWSLWR